MSRSGPPATSSDAASITNTPAGGIAATTVQAAINELDTEKANLAGNQTLGAGFDHTVFDFGTLTTTQTITPNPKSGYRQKVTAGTGSPTITIAATSQEGSLVLDLIFANSSGTPVISTSGFDKTFTGDTITATNTNKYRLYIENTGGVQSLLIKALQ